MAQMASLDTRTPVPLLPMMAWHQKQNMMQHLGALQKIMEAAAAEDFAAVIQSAQTIGSSPQMKAMCEHMGAGVPGFTDRALDFHQRADKIVVAAQKQDLQAVLRNTANTMAACNGCHAVFKQEIVDAGRYQELTGAAAPHH